MSLLLFVFLSVPLTTLSMSTSMSTSTSNSNQNSISNKENFCLMVCWRSWQHDTDFRGCEVNLWLPFFQKSIQINTNFDKASPQGKWKFFNSTNFLSVTVPRVNQSYNFKGTCNLSRNLCNHVNFVFIITTCSFRQLHWIRVKRRVQVRAIRAVWLFPRFNSTIELSDRRSLSDL